MATTFDTQFSAHAMPLLLATYGEAVEYAANGSTFAATTAIVNRYETRNTFGNIDYAILVMLPRSVAEPVPQVSAVKVAPQPGDSLATYTVRNMESTAGGAWVVRVN